MTLRLESTHARMLAGAALFGLAAGIAIPSTAFAQATQTGQPTATPDTNQTTTAQAGDQGVEEIVVTAQRRRENLQKVPIAVAAASAETLKETGIQGTMGIPALVPSVQFTRSGASGLVFIRGVGTTNAAVGEESSNAVYVDDVYMADLSQVFNNFNNIDHIEVLRGPQGTLFGRNATGGLIHIITKEPGKDFDFNGEVGYGNYNIGHAQMYVGGPVTNNISADLAFTGSTQADGWGRNRTLNIDTHLQDFYGVRSKIVLRASDAVKFVVTGDYNQNDDNLGLAWKITPGVIGTGGNTSPPGWDTTANKDAFTHQRIWGLSLKGEFDLGFATLTSVTAYRKTRNHSDFDVDGGPLNLVNIEFVSGSKSLQQEVRLASNDTNPLSWQVGVFYLHPESSNDSFFSGAAFGALAGQHILAKLKTNSYAAFGEATYAITPTTRITGGIRYTKDKRSFNGCQSNILANGNTLSTSCQIRPLNYDAWTWRVALRQDITNDVNVYASVNRGFKSGSFSLQSPLNAPYLPQTIMAYEAGLKSELFQHKLRLNLAAYHYDIKDYQVRSAAVANPGASLILNAATVKVNGIDVDFDAAPTEYWKVFGGATWLFKAEFAKFGGPGETIQAPIIFPVVASGQTLANSCAAPSLGLRDPYLRSGTWIGGWFTCFGDVSGNRMMNAPKLTLSLGTSYTVPVGASGEIRFTGLYSYNSGYFFEADNNPLVHQNSYNLVNASVEYRPSQHFGVELWGRNLTKAHYFPQKISSGTGTAGSLAAPRTWGVNLKWDF